MVTTHRTRLAVVGSVLVAVCSIPAAGAASSWATLDELGLAPPDAAQVDRSIIRYSAEGTIRPLETVEQEADEVVVTLAADILFDTDEAMIDGPAQDRIVELVADVPPGAPLAIHGHTDTVGTDEYNLDLSVRRARAVADVLRGSRPDLVLDVQGFGESLLAVNESDDELAGEPANRRVELRYRP